MPASDLINRRRSRVETLIGVNLLCLLPLGYFTHIVNLCLSLGL